MKADFSKNIIAFIEGTLLSGKNEDPLTVDDDLLSTGMVDSVGMMQLVRKVEEESAFEIPPEDLVIEHFMTVAAIEEYIRSKVEA